jgi:hypothetical protein
MTAYGLRLPAGTPRLRLFQAIITSAGSALSSLSPHELHITRHLVAPAWSV